MMKVSVRYTQPADPEAPDAARMGVLVVDGVEWSTVLPPEAGDLRGAYERFIEEGGVPEEFVEEPAPPPRSVAMWRARTIMKVTPWGDGTLFEAVQSAIAALEDPLQKAAAEEALERGDIFDRDGVFVPILATAVGITDEALDALMAEASRLPA